VTKAVHAGERDEDIGACSMRTLSIPALHVAAGGSGGSSAGCFRRLRGLANFMRMLAPPASRGVPERPAVDREWAGDVLLQIGIALIAISACPLVQRSDIATVLSDQPQRLSVALSNQKANLYSDLWCSRAHTWAGTGGRDHTGCRGPVSFGRAFVGRVGNGCFSLHDGRLAIGGGDPGVIGANGSERSGD